MYCKNHLWEKSNEVSRVSPEFPGSSSRLTGKLNTLAPISDKVVTRPSDRRTRASLAERRLIKLSLEKSRPALYIPLYKRTDRLATVCREWRGSRLHYAALFF